MEWWLRNSDFRFEISDLKSEGGMWRGECVAPFHRFKITRDAPCMAPVDDLRFLAFHFQRMIVLA
jgi:hypothetical protein